MSLTILANKNREQRNVEEQIAEEIINSHSEQNKLNLAMRAEILCVKYREESQTMWPVDLQTACKRQGLEVCQKAK